MSTTWWYLSSCDKGGFAGAAVVRATDIVDAGLEANLLRIPLGVDVVGMALEDGQVPVKEFREVLLPDFETVQRAFPSAVCKTLREILRDEE